MEKITLTVGSEQLTAEEQCMVLVARLVKEVAKRKDIKTVEMMIGLVPYETEE